MNIFIDNFSKSRFVQIANILLLKSQAVDGAYVNYVFEGTGSAQSDGSTFFERIGAVVYAYNSKEVNLWYPGSEDYLIFIGGAWGSGAPTQTSRTASVSVKVIKAESTLSGITNDHKQELSQNSSYLFIIIQYNALSDWSIQ